MRKKFYLIFGILVFIFSLSSVKADSMVTGKVTVGWLDYEDKMQQRPDSLDLELYEMYNDAKTVITLDVKDATVENDSNITWWTFAVSLPKYDDVFYTIGANPNVDGYTFDQTVSSGSINGTGGSITVFFSKHFSKYVTYTEHWDDDNQRDMPRIFAMWMRPINNDRLLGTGVEDFPRSLGCGGNTKYYTDDNTCQMSIYIPYIYPFDENGVPQWDDPTVFDYDIYDKVDDYEYRLDIDDYGNIDVYIKHDPYMLDDSKVEVIWEDNNDEKGKRPKELILDLYNIDVLEQSITLKENNWQAVITNLYENYSYLEKSNYTLKVDNTSDYEFEVTGDNTYGFKVSARYIEEELDEVIDLDKEKLDNVIDDLDEENPKTSDNIYFYIIILGVMVIITIISIYFIRKKKD